MPGGAAILKDKVSRLFPTDDSPPLETGEVVSVSDAALYDLAQNQLRGHDVYNDRILFILG